MMDDFLQYWVGTQYSSPSSFNSLQPRQTPSLIQVDDEGEEEYVSPYYSDLKRLKDRFGFLVPEKIIETTLQDLLKLCPRRREKTDAYNGLVKHLKENYDVNLIITSRKKNKQ